MNNNGNGGTARITGGKGGTGGTITLTGGNGGSAISLGGNGGSSWSTTGNITFYPLIKKPIDILLDEIKTSLLGELDGYYNALENKIDIQKNYSELLAKAEYNAMLFIAAAEAIKEKTDKLKIRANQFLVENLDIKE